MGKRYALFDWDNTVRNGYTLFSWIDFLCGQSILKPGFQSEIEVVKKQYRNHTITHDQYADIACSRYAKALKGVPFSTINRALSIYMAEDRKCLFHNIGTLFDMLHERGIDIIIISGAPEIIVSKYKAEFNLRSIYAFREETLNKNFTGNVECNFGFNKEEQVLKVIDEYHDYPYMAFGDSDSDVPMLKKATYPFCMGNKLTDFKNINIAQGGISEADLRAISKLIV